uniref:Uncharacterized protein n=1 Tax=Arundo donax TaxID=35708 RepID=A0A0A8YRG5_ARUDO
MTDSISRLLRCTTGLWTIHNLMEMRFYNTTFYSP